MKAQVNFSTCVGHRSELERRGRDEPLDVDDEKVGSAVHRRCDTAISEPCYVQSTSLALLMMCRVLYIHQCKYHKDVAFYTHNVLAVVAARS